MKPFRQYITERLAIEDNPNAYTPPAISGKRSAADIAFERRQSARYGGVMARLAAKALAQSQRKAAARPRKNPFPWSGGGYNVKPGWWHPTKEWFTFDHGDPDDIGGGNYHVTEIARNPKRFGISTAELNAGLMKEGKFRNSMGMTWYDSDGDEHPYSEPEDVRAEILNGSIDLAYEVQRLAYMKGWLKVYSGTAVRSPSLEGINGESIRAALREISESGGDYEVVMVDRVGLTRNSSEFKRYNPKDWRNAS